MVHTHDLILPPYRYTHDLILPLYGTHTHDPKKPKVVLSDTIITFLLLLLLLLYIMIVLSCVDI